MEGRGCLNLVACALLAGTVASAGEPPRSPAEFNPDPQTLPVLGRPLEVEPLTLGIRVMVSTNTPPLPPASFNPDPGARPAGSPLAPFFRPEYKVWPPYGEEPVEPPLTLPRFGLRSVELVEVEPQTQPDERHEPLPEKLKLPRAETRIKQRVAQEWDEPEYMHEREPATSPTNTVPVVDRWKVKFAPWQRYSDRPAETPYQQAEPALWHPYRQSELKGDAPVIGQDIFLSLTAASETLFEARRLPTPSGVSTERPGSAEFFGQGDEQFVLQNFSFTAELFKGETVFQPVHWLLRVEPVYNINYVTTEERGVISPNPTRGTDRLRDYLALQQAFAELHLGDLSNNYDFWATRVGNQPFVSDFRGFVFDDVNLGVRLFGNADNNRWQYNAIALPMREKDTNSGLNTFDDRDQYVFILNAYRQDFLTHGYTAQLSFHANLDDGHTHYDRNGNLARPEPLGTVVQHDVHAYYIGWTGDGHIGRFNITHAFYEVLGRDDFNGLAGRPVDINAQMVAVELSYDRDWMRYKFTAFYASGDGKAGDGTATGFDGIVDNPAFAGAPFSYWVRQGFNLAGTSIALKQRDSLVPDLRTSKTEGQANFVNPGLILVGVGADADILPKLRAFANVNYLWFAQTDPIETALLTDKVDNEIGLDCSIGLRYRPLLTDNIVVLAGFGVLVPGNGYRDIYARGPSVEPNARSRRGMTDDFLYSGLLTVTLTY
jgi:hypothetical protein